MTVTKAERIIMAQNIRILNHLEEITKSIEIYASQKTIDALENNYHDGIEEFMSNFIDCPVEVQNEAMEIFNMFKRIDLSLRRLSSPPSLVTPKFKGFDGNYDEHFLSFARYVIDTCERYQDIMDPDTIGFNSHGSPSLSRYRKMVDQWKKIDPTKTRADLTGGELKKIDEI
jgi:uncharacterized protein YfbU (UPF0304 family)